MALLVFLFLSATSLLYEQNLIFSISILFMGIGIIASVNRDIEVSVWVVVVSGVVICVGAFSSNIFLLGIAIILSSILLTADFFRP